MSDENKENVEPIKIIFEDRNANAKIEYKVSPDVAKAIMTLLDSMGDSSEGLAPKWDSGCYV